MDQRLPFPLLPDSARWLLQQGQRSRIGNLVTPIVATLLFCSKALIKRRTRSLYLIYSITKIYLWRCIPSLSFCYIIRYNPIYVEMYTFSLFIFIHYHNIPFEMYTFSLSLILSVATLLRSIPSL